MAAQIQDNCARKEGISIRTDYKIIRYKFAIKRDQKWDIKYMKMDSSKIVEGLLKDQPEGL